MAKFFILFLAAVMGGALNAVAGGGTFTAFLQCFSWVCRPCWQRALVNGASPSTV